LSGHIAQILGDVMENEFASLLEKLSYRIVQRRNISPSFDFICDIVRRPLDGSLGPALRSPWFSPAGRTAFSVKEGDLRSKDVKELKKGCRAARHSRKALLRKISGGVIVTNEVLPNRKLTQIRKTGLYCWDMRRLLFYSTKARIASQLPRGFHAAEYRYDQFEEASCLLWPKNTEPPNAVLKGEIFVDDHKCNLSADDVADLLRETYRLILGPTARRSLFSITAELSLHVLGMVDPPVARTAYEAFTRDNELHRGITMRETSNFRVYQYRPASWASML
jgi:hypothetical protein